MIQRVPVGYWTSGLDYKRLFYFTLACLIALASIGTYRRYAPRHEQIVQVPKWSSALDRVDMNAPTGCVVFIGDSHIAGLYTDNIATPSVNLGIGGDTTLGVLERIGRYQCIKTARAVVIEVGVNDLQWRGEHEVENRMFGILNAIPTAIPIFVCHIPPVDEYRLHWKPVTMQRIEAFNQYLDGTVWIQHSVRVISMDALLQKGRNLNAAYDAGDGIHLNRAGYQVLERSIREALIGAGVNFWVIDSNGPVIKPYEIVKIGPDHPWGGPTGAIEHGFIPAVLRKDSNWTAEQQPDALTKALNEARAARMNNNGHYDPRKLRLGNGQGTIK